MTQLNNFKMEKLTKSVVFLTICVLFLTKFSTGIYVPEHEQYQKPRTYSSGIKTSSYERPSRIEYNHNYSQVYHQNGYPTATSRDDEKPSRPFPVYNGHTYGAVPPRSEHLTIYVINGTKIRKNENPTRQVVIYNKQKRSSKIEVHRVCPDNATGQFVYESSCNQFLNCWKGRGYVQNCAPGTLFNPKTLECDFPEKVECVTGPRLSILQREKSAKIVKQIGCPKEFSGLIPNYTNCSKFINCVSGIENFMDCPPGTLFDMNKNICDFAHKADCFNGENEKLKRQNVDGKLDFGTSGCDQHRSQCLKNTHQRERFTYRDNEIRCPDNADGLYKHPTDCSKFLNCAHGQTYIQDCAPGTFFNPLIKICDFPYNVRCKNEDGSSVHHQHQYDKGSSIYGTSIGQHGGTYESSTGQYGGSWGYNKGSNSYSTSTNYGDNRNNWERDQYYNRDTTNTYHQGIGQESGIYGINKGSVGIYQPGESGIYGTGNRSLGGYKHGETSTYGVPNHYQENQNSWGHGSSDLQPNIYSSTRDQYGRGTSGSYNGQGTYSEQRTNGIYNGQGTSGNYGGQGTSGTYGGQGTGGTYDRQRTSGVYDRQGTSGNYGGQRTSGTYSGQRISDSYGGQGTDAYGIIQTNYRRDQYPRGETGGYNEQNYYSKGSRSHGAYGNTYNNFERDQYGRGETDTYNQQNYYNKGLRGQESGNYGSTQNGWIRGEPVQTYEVSTNQNNWDRNQYSRGSYGKGTFAQQPQNQNSWRQGQVQGSTVHQSGTYGQTDWGREPYNQGSSVYNVKPSQHFNNQYKGNNGLGQEPLYNRDITQNQKGQDFNNRFNKVYGQHQPNHQQTWNGQSTWQNNLDDESVTTNYDQVVNINHIKKTTMVPFRKPYEPFFGTTAKSRYNPSQFNDYDDTFGASSTKYVLATTPRIVERNWPPPFPSTDVNADYVFKYEDVSLEAENSVKNGENQNNTCGKSDFRCSTDSCIPKTLICNGVKDCPHGNDELKCLEYVAKFSVNKNHKLAILEKERWNNITIATCALLCIETRKFQCRSFNYRKIDKTCFLTDSNEALTGGLISHYPFDYYELISERIDCSDKYVCGNKKCIDRGQICDGKDDCGDRMDEKGCKPEDFGYSVKLTGSKHRNEGQIEVSAFGKTGYVCDDKFGLTDAAVVCKELGFDLGAVEVKGNSFYMKNVETKKPFYMMDDVTCSGNETRLMDCDFSGWGVHNCLAQEVVGVVCKTPQEKCPDDYWQCDTGRECLPLAFVCDEIKDCTDGSDEKTHHCDAPTEIRLVNGTNRSEGRIEIKHHGTWGTICDDDFNEDAAKVVCKHLGYKGSAVVKKDGYFGAGSGPIWLDQVFCTGDETTIENCTHWNWGEHNCEHSEDVGVICSNIYEYERHSLISIPQAPQEYPNRCGYRKDSIFHRDDDVHFRVVRGSIANSGDYPWQAAIRVKGKTKAAHWCGAVIISEKFVLTAAHCLLGYSKGAYIVVAGDYNVDEDEGTEQEAYIEDFYIHEDFRQGHKMNNDIALIKLKGNGFRFNEDIQPICLPENNTRYEREDLNCTISGFGSIESGKSAFSHDLRAGWIPIQKREICTMPHVYGDALTEGMICAGSLDEGTDSCDGDSGGPLACLHNGVFTLYGITSWGQHCGYANKPGVYVKVAHYRNWIDDNFHKHSKS